MKTIAVSATEKSLDSPVDLRFGRAKYFVIVDPETMDWEALDNTPNINAAHGAGIQAARLVAENRVKTVLTGNCGPNAFETLQAAGIQVATNVNSTVRQAIERFKRGEISFAQSSNVKKHWG
ncbi:MAG: dinitrogenase iron-molybdenum cofactor biosynthesis protein [Desulfobacca sp. 4484_104]|nr:MAG: dinitrogenase iron-molybdenum cofactor biosynthesis protein [Desulfobacca sp. 4484_104]RLA90756.1 MAG: dinitrogenase iron-molybdenum cofactor biosynthesis protein [Deltaproteobacteria bacterium]